MIRRWAFIVSMVGLLVSCLLIGPVLAQQAGVTTPPSWKEFVAMLINTAGVALAVQVIKFLLPVITDKYGWALPILAMIAGPAVAALQGVLTRALGYPSFDFSLIVAALTGGAAVAANQVFRQAKEGPTGGHVRLFTMVRRRA